MVPVLVSGSADRVIYTAPAEGNIPSGRVSKTIHARQEYFKVSLHLCLSISVGRFHLLRTNSGWKVSE